MKYIQLSNPIDRCVAITLNRPEKRNALNREMVDELKAALQELSADKQCRIILIKGNREAFCAGADLQYIQDLQSFTREQNQEDSSNLAELFKLIYTHPKMIVTQVEGPALAGGCGLATVADFCFATPESSFGYTESRIGFVPAIVMIFLIRKLGDQKARELVLSGDIIDGTTAANMGLVQRICAAEEIDDNVSSFIEKMIQRNSGESIRLIKEMMAKIPELPLDAALNYAADMNAEARESADCKHGIASFLNKERPKW